MSLYFIFVKRLSKNVFLRPSHKMNLFFVAVLPVIDENSSFAFLITCTSSLPFAVFSLLIVRLFDIFMRNLFIATFGRYFLQLRKFVWLNLSRIAHLCCADYKYLCQLNKCLNLTFFRLKLRILSRRELLDMTRLA